jgi:hypothetical protein
LKLKLKAARSQRTTVERPHLRTVKGFLMMMVMMMEGIRMGMVMGDSY